MRWSSLVFLDKFSKVKDFCPKKTFKNRIYNYREKQRNETVPVEQPQQDRIDVPDNGFGIGTTFDV